jgi:hypothetical protein
MKKIVQTRGSTPGLTASLLLLLSLSLVVHTAVGQHRLGLWYTAEEIPIWRDRLDNGPYLHKGDTLTNSIGDGDRVKTNAASFFSSPSSDRYANYYTGTGYVPRDAAYDPQVSGGRSAGIKMRDAAFVSLLYRNHPNSTKAALSASYATAVITELKWPIDREISSSDHRKAFDWTDGVRWNQAKPKNFQDNAPGFLIAEWLTKYLLTADMVRSQMSGADSTKIYTWISQAAYYMQSNYETDTDEMFVNRSAGNYAPHAGFYYTQETDPTDVKQLYSTSSAVGPKAHKLTRFYSNRRETMVYFVGAAGIALNDAYLIGRAKLWFREMIRFGINPLGDFVDYFRSITDKHPSKGIGYSHLGGLYMFSDMLALTGDFSLYLVPEVKGSLITSGVDAFGDGVTPKTPLTQVLRLCDIRNHVVNIYASLTPTSDVSLRMDGANTVTDGLFAVVNRFHRNSYISHTYHRTYSGTGGAGSTPFPSTPASSGSDIAASVLGQLPCIWLPFAGMENRTDRYNQVVTDPGGDTLTPPPPPPPPPIVSHWADFSDTITITAPTHFLNYTATKALVHGDTVGVGSRYVTNHSGNDTLTYLFPSARGLDSLGVVTGRDRFDPEASYRIEYKHSGTWTSLIDETANTATTRLYNVNVGSADGIRYIWRKNTDYTRVKEASVKITSPF